MILTPLPKHYCPHIEHYLEGYIIENIFPSNTINLLTKYISQLYSNTLTKTFGKHNTIFVFNEKKFKLLQNLSANREIYLIYDIFSNTGYGFQTKNTIKEYCYDYIKKNSHPIFYNAISYLSNLEIFNDNKEDYIPIRCHLNWLVYEKNLGLHWDGDLLLTNKNYWYETRLKSLTIYLNEISYGGQFYTSTGFVYDPKFNSGIIINGTKILHGVNENKDKNKTPRLAFTVRFIHKDDIFLPGHPSKFLYNISRN